MFRKMTAVTTALAISIMMTACGGEEGPTGAEPPGARAAPAQTGAETNAQTRGQAGVPAPTRPQRLEFRPTEEPSGTPETGRTAETGRTPETGRADVPGGTPQTGRATVPGGTPETGGRQRVIRKEVSGTATPEPPGPPEPARPSSRAPKTLSGDMSPEDLIPEDPETNEQVLLQDIYALMDLNQFALDPNGPIPLPNKSGMEDWSGSFTTRERGEHPPTLFDYEETRDHPYLHLFPGLKGYVEVFQKWEEEGRPLIKREFRYHPNRNSGTASFSSNSYDPGEAFLPMDPITHFIYHPWFEPVEYIHLEQDITRFGATRSGGGARLDRYQIIGEGKSRRFAAMPHWFGANSTRGVIADAVARALEQARRPGVEEHPLPAINIKHIYARVQKADYGGSRDLAAYLRTPISIIDRDDRHNLPSQAYTLPFVQWEFLHPRLPIIKVTSFVGTKLPLANPGEDQRTTRFAVSFVISFQNRWASFDDPNRWLTRFEHKLDTKRNSDGTGSLGGINKKLHERRFPWYWHTTDYMQHRLIGPVIVQVYKDKPQPPATTRYKPKPRGPQVLEPGVYAVYPKVSHWEAPGPILKDEHIVVEPLLEGSKSTKGFQTVRPAPQGSYPNPGWPLPGHVMTNPATGPGTKIWKDADLDWHDW